MAARDDLEKRGIENPNLSDAIRELASRKGGLAVHTDIVSSKGSGTLKILRNDKTELALIAGSQSPTPKGVGMFREERGKLVDKEA